VNNQVECVRVELSTTIFRKRLHDEVRLLVDLLYVAATPNERNS